MARRIEVAGRKVNPVHTVYCGTRYFVHGVFESLREYLSAYDVRDRHLFRHHRDRGSGWCEGLVTLANYNANKSAIGGGIGAPDRWPT